ncbi:MAG TPA: glutathionylspermidine synthase family protein [Deltaproteobacteria bacterium]|nr:glutathionylspermidine synthase family protein [Deltaproteobacteria bacterium]HQB38684.1 glutathionylspermidine synthase family protein [Deltaproteobacteria bacterium]
MERFATPPRFDWQQTVESQGMAYHTIDGQPYWDETAYYAFSPSEIDQLDIATQELHEMCIKAAEHVITNRLYSRLMIPEQAIGLIERSWEDDAPSILGRFDLAYDGHSPPKMLEYNADTPTALLEASVIQWFWLQDRFPKADQFNSIHEKLIAAWSDLKPLLKGRLYFSCVRDAPEDLGNIEYLRDTAMQAGLETEQLFVEDIGYDAVGRQFVDVNDEVIRTMFKLYPWEWLTSEYFGRYIEPSGIAMIEPAWKMILSNKGILPILWELFPGHPNLLRASFDSDGFRDNYVTKPLLSREGGNISICRDGLIKDYEGTYGGKGCIYQELAPIPVFSSNYPVIGSWVIYGEAAGIGIREDMSPVTTNNSRFVPHIFE